MKKTNIKTKVIAGIMAAICSVSALGAISAVSASAREPMLKTSTRESYPVPFPIAIFTV